MISSTSEELEWIPLDQIDIIQLPISIYDQDFKNKTIELRHWNFHSCKKHIYAGNYPEHSSKCDFSSEFREHHNSLQMALKRDGLNFLDAAIGFTKSIAELEYILVGVVKPEQLVEISSSYKKFDVGKDYCFLKGVWAWQNEREINPSKWPIL